MNIKIAEEQSKGKVYIGDENTPQAEMLFTKESESKIVVQHTEVSEELKGQGVGRKLLDHLAEKARNENWKVKAECSYVEHAFNKYDDYNDVKA